MEYLLVVYFLINGAWLAGEDVEKEGWSSMAYPTLEECLAAKARGEEIFEDLLRVNPRAYQKRFECEPHELGSDG